MILCPELFLNLRQIKLRACWGFVFGSEKIQFWVLEKLFLSRIAKLHGSKIAKRGSKNGLLQPKGDGYTDWIYRPIPNMLLDYKIESFIKTNRSENLSIIIL